MLLLPETSPADLTQVLPDYSAYRELALAAFEVAHESQALPDFFAPRPMSGTMTFGAA